MAENKNAKTPADGPEYERGFVEGMQRQMQLHVNRVIKTWNERCEEHPDHQERIISERMIQARMQEEIDELRQALETKQEPVAWISDSPTKGNGKRLHWTKSEAWRWSSNITPLYTAPPRKREWVGLTDGEIDILSCETVKGNKSVNWLCKVLEAKLKEKNHG